MKKNLERIYSRMQEPENWDNRGICPKLMPPYSAYVLWNTCVKELYPELEGLAYPVAAPTGKHRIDFYYVATPQEFWDRSSSQYAVNRWGLLEDVILLLEEKLETTEA